MVDAYVFAEADAGFRSRRRLALPAGPAPAWAASPPDLAAELDNAAEGRRVVDLLGRALVLPDYRDADAQECASLAAEAAFDALRAEHGCREWGVGGAGLVSVPTSGTSRWKSPNRLRSKLIARAASDALASDLQAFVPSSDAQRVAKLRRAVGFAGRVHCSAVDLSARCVMVTLTYRDGGDWLPYHITGYVKCLRTWCARRGLSFRYCWVAELQKRGAIHYHLAVWLPADVRIPTPDECGWWTHGMSNVKQATSAIGYLMKYLSKGNKASDHQLPGGARAYGCGGLGQSMRLARRWLSLPGFIRARADVARSAGWRRAPGGGWADADGVIWPSEYERQRVGSLHALVKVRDHGRPHGLVGSDAVGLLVAEHGGPFSFLHGMH